MAELTLEVSVTDMDIFKELVEALAKNVEHLPKPVIEVLDRIEKRIISKGCEVID